MYYLFAASFAEACCVWVDFQEYMCMELALTYLTSLLRMSRIHPHLNTFVNTKLNFFVDAGNAMMMSV